MKRSSSVLLCSTSYSYSPSAIQCSPSSLNGGTTETSPSLRGRRHPYLRGAGGYLAALSPHQQLLVTARRAKASTFQGPTHPQREVAEAYRVLGVDPSNVLDFQSIRVKYLQLVKSSRGRGSPLTPSPGTEKQLRTIHAAYDRVHRHFSSGSSYTTPHSHSRAQAAARGGRGSYAGSMDRNQRGRGTHHSSRGGWSGGSRNHHSTPVVVPKDDHGFNNPNDRHSSHANSPHGKKLYSDANSFTGCGSRFHTKGRPSGSHSYIGSGYRVHREKGNVSAHSAAAYRDNSRDSFSFTGGRPRSIPTAASRGSPYNRRPDDEGLLKNAAHSSIIPHSSWDNDDFGGDLLPAIRSPAVSTETQKTSPSDFGGDLQATSPPSSHLPSFFSTIPRSGNNAESTAAAAAGSSLMEQQQQQFERSTLKSGQMSEGATINAASTNKEVDNSRESRTTLVEEETSQRSGEKVDIAETLRRALALRDELRSKQSAGKVIVRSSEVCDSVEDTTTGFKGFGGGTVTVAPLTPYTRPKERKQPIDLVAAVAAAAAKLKNGELKNTSRLAKQAVKAIEKFGRMEEKKAARKEKLRNSKELAKKNQEAGSGGSTLNQDRGLIDL